MVKDGLLQRDWPPFGMRPVTRCVTKS